MRNAIIRILQALVIVAVASSLAHADNFMYFKKKAVAAGASAIAVDLLTDFETGTNGDNVTATNLAAGSHPGTLPGTWSVTDASFRLKISTSGETTTRSSFSVGGTTYNDSGSTRGMSYSLSGGNIADAIFTPTTAKNTVSVGFWYTTCTPANYDYGPMFLQFYNDANGNSLKLIDQKNGGSNNREISITGSSSSVINVSNATKYWITVKYVKNGTGSVSVYDTSGGLVGSNTVNTYDYVINSIYFGNNIAITTQTQTVYFDDIVLDWTNAVYPLGP